MGFRLFGLCYPFHWFNGTCQIAQSWGGRYIAGFDKAVLTYDVVQIYAGPEERNIAGKLRLLSLRTRCLVVTSIHSTR